MIGTRYDAHATVPARLIQRNSKPIPVGAKITQSGVLTDKYIRKGMEYAVIESVCRPEELAWIATRTVATEPHWPTVLFSAKECVHKCYFPINGLQLGFQDVIVTPDTANNEFTVDLVNRPPHATVDIRQFRGRYAIEEPWIFTAIILDDP